MLLTTPPNGEPGPDLQLADNGGVFDAHRPSEEIGSGCSTPYVSAPSSPGRCPLGDSGYFFSAPASPMHYLLPTAPSSRLESLLLPTDSFVTSGSFEFEFSSRCSPNGTTGNGSMSSADELFLNGQIRPMKLSSHLQRPQILAPLLDLDGEDEGNGKASVYENRQESAIRGRDLRLRNRSLHRKARSLSPLRSAELQWREDNVVTHEDVLELEEDAGNGKRNDTPSLETTPSVSASSSRSSSSGRNSKKWIFLKDLLYRSKSEGSGNSKEKFWSSISFSPAKEKKLASPSLTPSSSKNEKDRTYANMEKRKPNKQVPARKSIAGIPTNGVSKRRVPPSPHELHYTTNRAQAEEMRKKTFLPYRQGLLGCLGFSSKGYGAINGLTRTLNPVSSR